MSDVLSTAWAREFDAVQATDAASKLTTGRRNNDHYGAAPEYWATTELLKRLARVEYGTVLEPCAGQGHIAAAIRAYQREHNSAPAVATNDIDPKMPANMHFDAALKDLYDPPPDWIITNPPFNLAPILVPIWVREARRGVACLLRLSYKEPVENRRAFLLDRGLDAEFTLPRMSFSGDGKTDSVTCSWMVWLNSGELVPGEKPIQIWHPQQSNRRLEI